MVDTIRTLAELNSLFADNTIGSISPQDIRDLMISQLVYGEIGSIAKSSIVLSGTWQALDFNKKGVFERGLNIDTVNKWIDQIPVQMKAILSMEVFFKGDVGEDYDFTVFKDPQGSPSSIIEMERLNGTILTAAQTPHHTWSVGVQLEAGDILQPAVRSANNNFELIFGLFRVQRLAIE